MGRYDRLQDLLHDIRRHCTIILEEVRHLPHFVYYYQPLVRVARPLTETSSGAFTFFPSPDLCRSGKSAISFTSVLTIFHYLNNTYSTPAELSLLPVVSLAE